MYNSLKKKILTKNFSVGVIGLGYVGLPLAVRFLKSNISVSGVDEDVNKIKLIKKGKSYIKSIKSENLKKIKKSCSFNYLILKNVDVIFICLPTPLKNNKPDLSYIEKCMTKLKKINLKDKIIILESTVYPGATRKYVNKILLKNDLIIGKNIFVGYSPERENPGDKSFSYNKTPKVISGYTKKCLNLTGHVYKYIIKKIVKANTIETAETSKLLENIYRAVNIGLINEMKIICENLSLDIHRIIKCAATKNFGYKPFYPGPGWGGHCIPIDPFYLSWISNQSGYDPKFIKNSGIINNMMPKIILRKIFKYLKVNKIKNPKLLLLGVSYKKNVDDDRESPAYQFMKILKNKKIKYDYSDPYFSKLRIGRNIKTNKKSIKINRINLKKYNGVILITDHQKFNYGLILKHSKMIFDTRGFFSNKKFSNVIQC